MVVAVEDKLESSNLRRGPSTPAQHTPTSPDSEVSERSEVGSSLCLSRI